MRIIKIATATVVCLLMLSACGQRGPLYAPPQEPEQGAPQTTLSHALNFVPSTLVQPTYAGA